MQSSQVGCRHLIRIQRGEEIVSSLTAYLREKSIRCGAISGIGAASRVTLRYYDMQTKEYVGKKFEGEFEIASMTGNISVTNGVIRPHVHIVLGDTEYRCFGGHLESAIVCVTCEVIVSEIDKELPRSLDKETGLQLWDLS
ncbi:DNA-binding protein [Candidatus Peregrinibacteria bacterium CG10_big_fil_rev_8_21_14_0_10_49_24]|nr:MAG: DNA-binding protein [Candidatus Peregrinibacteria bacterium CG11_big_fil_rev_8_21_14_0_20_49_14]PIR50515.1 MAG: DNA-binding protein [Candidatus Peregrinibacteria bacterium CG10_big_fil_rev_8_21_14_0_10_49_24]PJA67804.1 MAG: DNA-binding protein [Candidatus Peregrinibacteria bacterium CG_4_9_14_3_um_filter_49_12]